MKPRHTILLGLVATAGIAFFVLRESGSGDEDPEQGVALSAGKVRAPERSGYPTRLNYPGDTVSPPATAPEPAAAAPAGGGPTEEEQMREAHQRHEAKFAHDAADPAWAAEAAQIVNRKLPSLLPEGSTLRSFECHASLCRLETAHRNHDAYMTFIDAAFLRREGRFWNAPTYSTPLNDAPGDGLMVTYIAREGMTL